MSAIENPVMLSARPVTANWSILPAWLPVAGMGVLPVNSFLLKGREPLLVDTGLGALGETFMAALEAEIDPADLCWIWLSHMDCDHIGNLARVLERAPRARIVTNFLGAGKLGLMGYDTSRVHMLEPGAALEVGNHRLSPVRPPYYDAPETVGFFDERDQVFFAADSFGAMLPEMAETAEDLASSVLRDGMIGWATVDAPWLGQASPLMLGRTLWALERLRPRALMSGHLPVARGRIRELAGYVVEAHGHAGRAPADPLGMERLLVAAE